VLERLQTCLQEESTAAGADLTYELSGNPGALNQAIAVTGFNGRIIIGSWYGTKRADLNLGGSFHRSRIRLISSQVSSIGAKWGGRWTKTRRLQVAWQMLQSVRPEPLITHHFPVEQAELAYALLDQHPEEAIQVLLTYEA
jgi:threonine dehydrogenase-like Zn-dependent dehydrogenase